VVVGLALSLAACGSGGTGGGARPRSTLDLTNPFLGPEYSGWMLGAASRLATVAEVQAFQALQDDAQAQAFVEQFWARRDPTPDRPGNAIQEAFEKRAAEADRLYSEAGFLGRNTDRGILLVLYGPPTKVDFEVSPAEDAPPIELWSYGPNAPSGIDGRRPAAFYRFLKRGDLTRIYQPGQENLRRRPTLRPPGA
jgi:GWxTD domain-containing protein